MEIGWGNSEGMYHAKGKWSGTGLREKGMGIKKWMNRAKGK